MDESDRLHGCFVLGATIAEYVHGISRTPEQSVAMFRTLQDVADGSLTLLDTGAEMTAGMVPEMKQVTEESLRNARANERAMAKEILDSLPPMLRALL